MQPIPILRIWTVSYTHLDVYKRQVGSYASTELECIWNVSFKNNRLVLSNQKIKEIKLKHSSADKFGFIEFLRDDSGKVMKLLLSGEGIEFLKIK